MNFFETSVVDRCFITLMLSLSWQHVNMLVVIARSDSVLKEHSLVKTIYKLTGLVQNDIVILQPCIILGRKRYSLERCSNMNINVLKSLRTWSGRQTLTVRWVTALAVVVISVGAVFLILLASGADCEKISHIIGTMLVTIAVVTPAPLLLERSRS